MLLTWWGRMIYTAIIGGGSDMQDEGKLTVASNSHNRT